MDDTLESEDMNDREVSLIQDKYEKLGLIGQGASGKVILVKSEEETYVLKIMSTFGKTKEEIQGMQKEATILKELNHPNIINFHDSFLDDKERFCILMEYAPGGDLSTYLKTYQKNRLQESQILDWFTQIALAIHHVHSKNIIHRDIKSDNIFLSQDQKTLKLGDFGIAKIFENKNDKARTFAGTPYYLSPEIVQNRPYSYKSDIWSLGILLYQLCALKLPFEADSIHFLAIKIVRGKYQPLSATFYSSALRQLVQSMLQQDPVKRPNIEQIIKNALILPRVKAMTNEFQDQINVKKQVKQEVSNWFKEILYLDSAFLENIKKREEQQKKQKAEEERKKAAIRQKKEQEKVQKEKEREEARKKMRDDIQKKIHEQKQKQSSNEVIIEQFGQQKEKEEKKPEATKKKQRQKEIVVEIFLPNYKKNTEGSEASKEQDKEEVQNEQNEEEISEEKKEAQIEQKDQQEDQFLQDCNKENQDLNLQDQDEYQVPNEFSAQKQSKVREMNIAEEESLNFISDYGKVEELKLLLEGYFGTETFMKAYHIFKKEAETKEIDQLAKEHGHNFYQDILPFIEKEKIINYIPFLLTLIYMEQSL